MKESQKKTGGEKESAAPRGNQTHDLLIDWLALYLMPFNSITICQLATGVANPLKPKLTKFTRI